MLLQGYYMYDIVVSLKSNEAPAPELLLSRFLAWS